MYTSKKVKIILLTFSLVALLVSQALAQGPGLPGEPMDTPIDGGISLALAATAAYGVKRLREKK